MRLSKDMKLSKKQCTSIGKRLLGIIGRLQEGEYAFRTLGNEEGSPSPEAHLEQGCQAIALTRDWLDELACEIQSAQRQNAFVNELPPTARDGDPGDDA